MSQAGFEKRHRGDWETLSQLLEVVESPSEGTELDLADLPGLYRQVCQHLALARERRYSTDLVARLNALALGGHDVLYREGTRARVDWLDTLLLAFPRALRARRGALLAAAAAFLVPGGFAYGGVRYDPDLVYLLMEPWQIWQLEAMYDPDSAHFLRERGAASDLMMFGHYIRNNIGIAFRTFAGGMLAGVGSLFFLVFNGAYIGAVSAHLDNVGYSEPFWSFVIGHGSFELTALVIAGVAGLRIGQSLLDPVRRTRTHALVEETREALPLVYGFTAMLLIAAFIEAFWSSMVFLPATTKYAVGAVLWVSVLGYLAAAGRRRGP